MAADDQLGGRGPGDARPGPRGALVPGLLDGRYRLDGLLGRGGMAAVYRAVDTRLDRAVAVKVLADAPGADDERFRVEVRMLARLAHPNLVRVLDAGEVEGRLYLVMELVEGTTLARRIPLAPLSPDEVVSVGAAVGAALSYVHAEGIVHRDVKPANILLDERSAYLADFGISRLVDSTGMTATGLLLGTPAYLAPEQLTGKAVGPPADVFALGLVLLEALTGRRAYGGTLPELAASRMVRDPEIPSGLDPQLGRLLAAMTRRDPDRRPAAAEVAAALAPRAAVASGAGTAVPGHPSLVVDPALGATAPLGQASHGDHLDPTVPATDVRARTARGGLALGLVGRWPLRRAGPRSRWAPGRVARRSALVAATIAGGLLLGAALRAALTGSGPVRQGARATANRVGATVRRGTGDGAATTRTGAAGRHQGAPAPSSTTTSTTSTTSTTIATTTTPPAVPTAGSAAGSLVARLAQAAAAGQVSAQAASQLAGQLDQVLFPPKGGTDGGRVGSFDQLVGAFRQDVAAGQIVGAPTVAALSRSLQELAAALGTTVPPVSAPASVTPGPGPGGAAFGHDHGKHKGGNGDG